MKWPWPQGRTGTGNPDQIVPEPEPDRTAQKPEFFNTTIINDVSSFPYLANLMDMHLKQGFFSLQAPKLKAKKLKLKEIFRKTQGNFSKNS